METIRKIQQAFGDDSMIVIQIKEWYNWFKDGCISVESRPRSGRSSTNWNDEVIDLMRTLVMHNHRVNITELMDKMEMHWFGTFHFGEGFGYAENLAAPSWKWTSPFFASDSDLPGQTQHFSSSSNSILSRHGSLQFLTVPQTENAAEMNPIWIARRY